MDKKNLEKLNHHARRMYFATRHATREYLKIITDEYYFLRQTFEEEVSEIKKKRIEKLQETGIEDSVSLEDIIPEIALLIHDRHTSKTQQQANFDIHTLYRFAFLIIDWAEANDLHISDPKVQAEFSELVESEMILNKLLNNNEQPLNAGEMFLYLFSGLHFYDSLLHQETVTPTDITNMLTIDREIAYIREEVAAIIATSEERKTKITSNIQTTIETAIKNRKLLLQIIDFTLDNRKQGIVFVDITKFCKAAEKRKEKHEKKIYIGFQSIRKVLEKAGITTKNFLEFQKNPKLALTNDIIISSSYNDF